MHLLPEGEAESQQWNQVLPGRLQAAQERRQWEARKLVSSNAQGFGVMKESQLTTLKSYSSQWYLRWPTFLCRKSCCCHRAGTSILQTSCDDDSCPETLREGYVGRQTGCGLEFFRNSRNCFFPKGETQSFCYSAHPLVFLSLKMFLNVVNLYKYFSLSNF